MATPKGLQWNKLQLQIAQHLKSGMEPKEVGAQFGLAMRTIYKVNKALKAGDDPGDITDEMIAAAPEPMSFGDPLNSQGKGGKVTPAKVGSGKGIIAQKGAAPVQYTSQLELVATTAPIPLTNEMYVSYMVAVKKGYRGGIGDWLSLTAQDFWLGREVNMYEEMAKAVGGGLPQKELAAQEA